MSFCKNAMKYTRKQRMEFRYYICCTELAVYDRGFNTDGCQDKRQWNGTWDVRRADSRRVLASRRDDAYCRPLVVMILTLITPSLQRLQDLKFSTRFVHCAVKC